MWNNTVKKTWHSPPCSLMQCSALQCALEETRAQLNWMSVYQMCIITLECAVWCVFNSSYSVQFEVHWITFSVVEFCNHLLLSILKGQSDLTQTEALCTDGSA